MGGGEKVGRRMRERVERVPESISPPRDVARSGPGVISGPVSAETTLVAASIVHTSCGATRAVRCGGVRCGYPVSSSYSTLPVLSHISVNCFHTAERKRRYLQALNKKERAERRRREKDSIKRKEEERGLRSPSPSPS